MLDVFATIKTLEKDMIACRRDLHQHPEAGWTEFRTASFVAEQLTKLGFEVYTGEQVVVESERMGVPSEEVLAACRQRALSEGAKQYWVDKMAGGKTGVVGVMHFPKPGKIVAFRVDMDCNEVEETADPQHLPNKEKFASQHAGLMHACGHDGHTTIGLTLARFISQHKDSFAGTIKIIFQCAEEGVRGAKAMVASGIVDDVDYLFGLHITKELSEVNSIICMAEGQLATSKIDAYFQGVPIHPAKPEKGKNAVLAAAQAIVSLNTIARHSQGPSFINVGVIQGGTSRNVVPGNAKIQLETRGSTSEINDFLEKEARRIINASAQLYDVKVAMQAMGSAPAGVLDAGLGADIYRLFTSSKQFSKVILKGSQNGSEDCTYFMGRVQKRGGRAVYLKAGTSIAAGNHTSKFDFGESVLVPAATAFSLLALHYTNL